MVYRYRFNVVGWAGAAMAVLPTPISVWLSLNFAKVFGTPLDGIAYRQALSEVRGTDLLLHDPITPAIITFTLLATVSIAGFVMVIVGRDLVADDEYQPRPDRRF